MTERGVYMAQPKQSSAKMARIRKIGVRTILFCMMVVGIGQAAVYTIFPLMARHFDFSEIQTSIALSIPALFWALSSPFWGRMSDRLGRKKVMILGLSGMALSMGLLSLVVYIHKIYTMIPVFLFVMLLASRSLFGLLSPGTFTSAIGYMADRTGAEDRSGGVAAIIAAFSIGTILGPGIGAALVGAGFTVPFAVLFAISCAAMFAVHRLVPETRSPSSFARKRKTKKLRYRDIRIRDFMIISFFSGIMQSVILQVTPFFVIDQMGLSLLESTQIVGVSMTAMAMANVFAQSVIVNHFRFSIESQYIYGVLSSLAGFSGFFFPLTQISLTFCMIALGVGFGLVRTATSSAASLSVNKDEQGAVAGLLGAAITFGVVMTPLVLMPLYVAYNLAPYYLAFLVMGIISTFARKAYQRGNYKEAFGTFTPKDRLNGPY